jgi:hypothetical protein
MAYTAKKIWINPHGIQQYEIYELQTMTDAEGGAVQVPVPKRVISVAELQRQLNDLRDQMDAILTTDLEA